MKRILGLLVLFLCVQAHAQDKLHVAAGKQYTVAAGTQELVLKELILEDGATLLIPSAIGKFQITADKASIGKQVKIVAAGDSGASGQNGKDRSGLGAECEPALAGEAGEAGVNGTAGTRITLSLAIARLGSLMIDTHGGDGGNGGNGGKGQDAGPFERCTAPDGGAGGAGGSAGNGGAGGSVAVYYSLLSGAEISGSVSDLIQVLASGGAAGEPGQGGQGGAGTEGKYVNMRTLAGSQKWIAGGKPGKSGDAGAAGNRGVDGESEIVRTGMTSTAPQNSPKQVQSVQTLDELNKRLAAQEQQLEQMSTKMNQVVKQLERRIELLEKKVK